MKTLCCKLCGEEVEVPDRQLSVVCLNCAEADLAEREFSEARVVPLSPECGEQLHAALDDARFRKGYLHHKALGRAKQF
jgi:hypothetical protein